MSGVYCTVLGCSNNTGMKKVSFFRFPKDPERVKKWLHFCMRMDLMKKSPERLYSTHKVCGVHFEKSMFHGDLQNRLSPYAYPTILCLEEPSEDMLSHKDTSLYSKEPMRADYIEPEKIIRKENGATKSPICKSIANETLEILPLGGQVKDWNIINMLKSKRIHRLQKTVALQKKQNEYLKSQIMEINTSKNVAEQMSNLNSHLLDHSYTNMDMPVEHIADKLKDSSISKFHYPSKFIPKMCRVCMKQYELLFQEATVIIGGLEISIQEIYYSVTRVQLTDNPELPNSLCKDCIEGMLRAYIFLKKALDANKALSTKLTNARINCTQICQNFIKESFKEEEKLIVEPGTLAECETKKIANHNKERDHTDSILKKLLENKDICKKESIVNNGAMKKLNDVIDLHKTIKNKETQDKASSECEFSEALNEVTDKSSVDVCDVINWKCDSEYIANGLSSAQLIKEMINKNRKAKNPEEDIIVQCKICNARLLISMIEDHKKKCSLQRIEGHFCSLCDKIFSTQGALAQHRRSNHSRILCSICGKLVRTANWKFHQNNHSGQLPYKCIICDKSFNAKHNLKKHIDMHNNKRQYKCKVCTKGFNRNSHLFVHMRTHTGQRPYICVICNKQFITNGNLKNHKKVHQIVINDEASKEECAV